MKYACKPGVVGLTLVTIMILAGCTSFGPRNIRGDRFNYNDAVGRSAEEQLLGNIVRVRHLEFPTFLAVSSIVTSYNYTGTVGLSAENSDLSDTLTGNVNLGYSEVPTISYAPLAGEDFAGRMFKPIPASTIFALGQSGWPIDLLLYIALEAVNDIRNASLTTAIAAPESNLEYGLDTDEKAASSFRKMVSFIPTLLSRHLIELGSPAGADTPELIFRKKTEPAQQALIDEFKDMLSLDRSIDVFKVTTNQANRKPGEIAIDTRSVFAIILFLARGVEIPVEQAQHGGHLPSSGSGFGELIPFHVRSQSEKPGDAFIAIRYRGLWYYIKDSDTETKVSMLFLLTLLQLLAPTIPGAAPVLTLPVSG